VERKPRRIVKGRRGPRLTAARCGVAGIRLAIGQKPIFFVESARISAS